MFKVSNAVIRRSLIVATLALSLAVAVISILLTDTRIEMASTRKQDTSIVRLHDMATGRFFCSGTIISTTRLLTAAHCIVQDFGFFQVKTEAVEVRTSNGRPIGLIAKPIAANTRQDIALLSGDFRGMDMRPVVTNATALNKIFMNGNITACGYPDAGSLQCSPMTLVRRMAFFFSANGWLYPGMSGGPVIDLATGAVIGVNTAVNEAGRALLSPTVEMLDMLDLNEAPAK